MADLDIKTDAQIERELDVMHYRLWGKNPSMNPLCLSDDQLEILEDAGWTRPKEVDEDVVFLRRLKARHWVESGIRHVAEEIMSGRHDQNIKDEMLNAYRAGKASAADRIKEIKARLDQLQARILSTENYDKYEGVN
jgi:hypothetical protein